MTADTNLSSTPNLCIAHRITSLGTLWKAFSKPTKPNCSFFPLTLKPHLHDTTSLTTVLNKQSVPSTGSQTALYNRYTIQPVVKPTLSNGFDNRLNEQRCTTGLTTGCIHDTAGCQTGCTMRFDNRLNVCIHDTTGCQTTLTTGCIVYTNI